MFDLELLAQPVEHVLPPRLLLLALAGEAIGELAAVVREQFAYFDWTCCLHFSQKIDAFLGARIPRSASLHLITAMKISTQQGRSMYGNFEGKGFFISFDVDTVELFHQL